MYRFENVSYHDIIESLYLEFKEGAVSCMTGPSGAGKSTILKFLNKMIIPTGGEILFQNKPLEAIDSIELRRQAVMLQQEPVIFDGSIEDNLQIGLKFSCGNPASRAELKEALKMVMLEKQLNEDANKLSGGEKQRLAIARIFIMKPKVFLLDEPTSALDSETEMKVMGRFLDAVKGREGTVIMITHSPTVAERFGDENIHIPLKGKTGECNE